LNHYDVSHLNIFIKSKERKQRKTKERPKKDDTHASSKRKTKKRKKKERRHPRFINCPKRKTTPTLYQ